MTNDHYDNCVNNDIEWIADRGIVIKDTVARHVRK